MLRGVGRPAIELASINLEVPFFISISWTEDFNWVVVQQIIASRREGCKVDASDAAT